MYIYIYILKYPSSSQFPPRRALQRSGPAVINWFAKPTLPLQIDLHHLNPSVILVGNQPHHEWHANTHYQILIKFSFFWYVMVICQWMPHSCEFFSVCRCNKNVESSSRRAAVSSSMKKLNSESAMHPCGEFCGNLQRLWQGGAGGAAQKLYKWWFPARHGGTPSSHLFRTMGLSLINHPAMGVSP